MNFVYEPIEYFNNTFDNYSFDSNKFGFDEFNNDNCPFTLKNENLNDNSSFFLNEEQIKNVNDLENPNEITREKTNYFNITKFGRKRKNENEMNYICHNKYRTDNILNKIQVHFINFIVDFLNIVIQHFEYKEQFYYLDYDFKKNVSKKYIRELKELNIGDIILFNQKSPKYKRNKEENKDIYRKIKNYPNIKIIENILSYKFIDFFKYYYCNKDNFLSLKNFGSDDIINVYKKAEMYKDLKLKFSKEPLYIEKLDLCKKNYENIK